MTRRGFTLLEVMIALALLGLALGVLIKSSAGSVFAAEEAHMMGVATDLARGKMYDIEEKLLKDGFTDTDQSQSDFKPFEEEGWPNVFYKYDVIQVEFPSFDQLQAMAMGQALGSGSAARGSAMLGSGLGSGFDLGSNDPLSSFQNSALGGMMSMMGGLGGGGLGAASSGVTGAQGASLIQSQYQMFQQILKVTVRKVKLTVKYQVLGRDRDFTVVAFFTDPAAMDQVLNGLGSQPLTGMPGTGSGTGSSTTTRPPMPGGRP
ncbi:MAG: prepilin-type N-terminal cleavage/methylation domain-containing protein [Acidobacteriota bacterium]